MGHAVRPSLWLQLEPGDIHAVVLSSNGSGGEIIAQASRLTVHEVAQLGFLSRQRVSLLTKLAGNASISTTARATLMFSTNQKTIDD
jgi:hypothetical protein